MQNYMSNGQVPYNNVNKAPLNQGNSQSQIQPQHTSIPNYSGVSINIINPMVNPDGSVVYPTQTLSAFDAGTNGGCYPSSYYVNQPGAGYQYYPQTKNANGKQAVSQTSASGLYDADGKFHPYIKDQNGKVGYLDNNGNFVPVNTIDDPRVSAQESKNKNGFYDKDGKFHEYTTNDKGEKGYVDENGNFHPVNADGTDKNGFYDKDGKFHEYTINDKGEKGYVDENGNFHPVNADGTDKNGFYDKDGKFHEYTTNDKGEKGYVDENGNFHPVNADGTDKNGFYDKDGKFHEYTTNDKGEKGYVDENGNFHPVNADGTDKNGFYDKDGKFHEYTTNDKGEKGYVDENGNFHPVNADGTLKNNEDGMGSDKEKDAANTSEKVTEKEVVSEKSDGAKTEKKKVVALTNDYIKTIENYLNSQDLEVRKMGAHEVVDRILEDSSRADDPALTALVNKMLQDPSSAIRAIALSMVESRSILGDDLTVDILKKMQKNNDGFGLDATQATNALLKMAGKTIEKEVPVDETKKEKAEK